jgi:hypothetical protein
MGHERQGTKDAFPDPGGPADRTDDHLPLGRPSMIPAARWVARMGPGTRARPSSSKTTAAAAIPSPTPPAASGTWREKTPASARSSSPRRR